MAVHTIAALGVQRSAGALISGVAIEHISDTARWVATYRAMESARTDALFHDPYAARLAGPRGTDIMEQMPRGRQMAWSMIVRTAVFDEIILDRVQHAGVHLVLDLAAGLDARPWRLPLPPTLRWVDVDLPDILDYKTRTLAGEQASCAYEPVPLDLRDPDARRALFARLGLTAQRALVVTEGLLIYLTEAQVRGLADDLHAQPAFQWWLIDLASPHLLRLMQRWWGRGVSAGNAPFQFAPASGTDFFASSGWREAQFRSTMAEARRLRREMRLMWLWRILLRLSPRRRREIARRMSGIVLLERA
ncbi:MAG TPA: class I SAM-dependent methyltransferase [Gemmatimonadaceae bacterium]|nr:class I SAM-dependent methyltransferase [Gemmatimonadaceae bacterium]